MEAFIIYSESTHQGESFDAIGDVIGPLLGDYNEDLRSDPQYLSEITEILDGRTIKWSPMKAPMVYSESTHQGESFYAMLDAIAPLFGEKNVEFCGDLGEIRVK
jgi:hypothetical protein